MHSIPLEEEDDPLAGFADPNPMQRSGEQLELSADMRGQGAPLIFPVDPNVSPKRV